MGFTYCIWYRVRDPGDREAETVIRALQARLACGTGVVGQLLKRRDAPEIWMELYLQVAEPERFERALEELTTRYDVDMFLADRRHVECFSGDAGLAPPMCTGEND